NSCEKKKRRYVGWGIYCSTGFQPVPRCAVRHGLKTRATKSAPAPSPTSGLCGLFRRSFLLYGRLEWCIRRLVVDRPEHHVPIPIRPQVKRALLVVVHRPRAFAPEHRKLMPAFIHRAIAIQAFADADARLGCLVMRDLARLGHRAEAHVRWRVVA